MTGAGEFTASRRRGWIQLAAALSILLCVAWVIRHYLQVAEAFTGESYRFGLVFAVTAALVVGQVLLYTADRPYRAGPWQQELVDQLRVVVAVPVYNEDPAMLTGLLRSVLEQTRRPQVVHLVVNGPHTDELLETYDRVRGEWETAYAAAGVELLWDRTARAGKRHGQGIAFGAHPDADVFVTVDSDGILDRAALAELLQPLGRRDVNSVAGVVLSANVNRNLLTRIADLTFLTGQLVDRSAASVLGAVLVNSGVLAAYRASAIRPHLDGYLNETFAGRPVEFSDDSMLTLYALQGGGRAVQQPTAFVFTLVPQNVGHFCRMYVRWMRGSTIRSLWRFRHLPVAGAAYWQHLLRWIQVAISTGLFIMLFAVLPIREGGASPLLLLVPVLIGYVQALRYLTVRRGDVGLGSQLATAALAPLAVVVSFFAYRAMRWYGAATCLRTGWGTRTGGVEVALDQPAPGAASTGPLDGSWTDPAEQPARDPMVRTVRR